MTKKDLRKAIRLRKAECPEKERRVMSETLCRKMLRHERWATADTVLLYHALSDEVDTALLRDAALEDGKRVLLPVVVGDDLELRVYTGAESLRDGAYGIMEPIGECFPVSRYGEVALVVVPGMAFDGEGHRLGRGKGYYDRLLPRLPRARKVGLCFAFQRLECVPAEPHDVLMDDVVSSEL